MITRPNAGLPHRPFGPGVVAAAGFAAAGLLLGAASAAVKKLSMKKTRLSLEDFEDVDFGPAGACDDGRSLDDGSAQTGRSDSERWPRAGGRGRCEQPLCPPAPPAHPSEREQARVAAAEAEYEAALEDRSTEPVFPVEAELDPAGYDPVCFMCGEPMKVSKPFKTREGIERWDCNVDGGLELSTVGEYGSAYWDEDGMGTRLSMIICDKCLEDHEDRLHVRPGAKPGDPWPKPTTMQEYNEKSSEFYAIWLDENGYELGEPIDMGDAVRMASERAKRCRIERRPVDDSVDRKHRRRGIKVIKPFTWDDAGERRDGAGDTAGAPAEDGRGSDDVEASAGGHAAAGGHGRSMLEAVYGLEPGEAPDDLLLPGDLSRMCNDLPRDPVKRSCESSIEFYARRLMEQNRESLELRDRLKRLEREVRRLRGQKGRSGAR